MASTTHPSFSISLSPKPTRKSLSPNTSSDLSLRLRSSNSAWIRCSVVAGTSVELNRIGKSAASRIMASSAQVVDQPTSKTGPVAPTVVDVNLGNRSYPIYIGSGLLDQPELLQRHVHGKKVLVVTNNTVAPLYLDKVTEALTRANPNVSVESVILPDGEKYKNMVNV